MILAKDPISFIREFNFKVFKPAVGTSATSSYSACDLSIALNTVNTLNEILVPEVHITSENDMVANQVADWLANDPRYKVYPYAALNEFTCGNRSVAHIHLVFADPNLNTQVLADELKYLIQHVVNSVEGVKSGETKLIRPKAERVELNAHQANYHGNGLYNTIGQSPQGNSRSPNLGGSRIPDQSGGRGINPNANLTGVERPNLKW